MSCAIFYAVIKKGPHTCCHINSNRASPQYVEGQVDSSSVEDDISQERPFGEFKRSNEGHTPYNHCCNKYSCT